MDETPTFCINHPGRPTALHCNRCGQPICAQCAVLTPVGYRCKTCVREQQKIFDTTYWYDFPVAFFVAAVICGVGSILSIWIGFFIVFLAVFVGPLAARAVQAAVRHRRNRYLWIAAVAGAVVGCLPVLLVSGLVTLFAAISGNGTSIMGALLTTIWPFAYVVIVVSTLAASMRGIRL